MSDPGTITVTVNGSPRELPAGTTLADLIQTLGLGTDRVAVELNLKVVRRADHPLTTLSQGDRVEIVTFVGGG